jgi:hypothetical protein
LTGGYPLSYLVFCNPPLILPLLYKAEEERVRVMETSKIVFELEDPLELTDMKNLAFTYWYEAEVKNQASWMCK